MVISPFTEEDVQKAQGMIASGQNPKWKFTMTSNGHAPISSTATILRVETEHLSEEGFVVVVVKHGAATWKGVAHTSGVAVVPLGHQIHTL